MRGFILSLLGLFVALVLVSLVALSGTFYFKESIVSTTTKASPVQGKPPAPGIGSTLPGAGRGQNGCDGAENAGGCEALASP